MIVYVIIFAVVVIRIIDILRHGWRRPDREQEVFEDTVNKLLSAGLPLTKALPEAESYLTAKYGSREHWPCSAEEMLYNRKMDWLNARMENPDLAKEERETLEASRRR